MNYTYENVTLHMSKLDADMQGDCHFVIPFAHKEFLTDGCGVNKNPEWNVHDNYEPLFFHNYGEVYVDAMNKEYYSTSADLLIAYMSWAREQDADITIDVQYSHFYWGIHDMQHALHDESGCTIYVNGYVEKERLIDAFKIMTELGYWPTYDMISEITKDFKDRFNMEIDLEEFVEPIPEWD